MRRLIIASVAACTLFFSVECFAKGCISGAAVGGVAGHVAGKHAVLGAVAGCAINHHRNAVKDRQAAAAAKAAQPTAATPLPPKS